METKESPGVPVLTIEQMKVDTPDIMTALLSPWADEKKPSDSDLLMLQGDTQLIINAGRSVLRYV